MFDHQKVTIDWAGRPLTLETGKIARQADGAVLATYGETVVLATVVSMKEPKPGVDFFPLTVNYQEKTFAAGRIPGGYFKREGRPTEREDADLAPDRPPDPPLFAEGYRNDTQVIVTVLQHDLENDSDIPAMVAVSAALTLSRVPSWAGRRGPRGLRQQRVCPEPDSAADGGVEARPRRRRHRGRRPHGRVRGQGAVRRGDARRRCLGQKGWEAVLDAIIRLAEKAAKEPRDFEPADHSAVEKAVLAIAEKELRAAYKITAKAERYKAVDAVKAKVMAELCPEEGAKFDKEAVKAQFKEVQAKIVRWNILDDGVRIDGRDLKTVRPIVSEVGVLPRTHGSALFTRGETQAIVVAPSAPATTSSTSTASWARRRRPSSCTTTFPPYSVGETGRMGSPGRREIGHGKLACAPSGQCCRPITISPTRSASCRRSRNRTAPPRWRPSAAPLCR